MLTDFLCLAVLVLMLPETPPATALLAPTLMVLIPTQYRWVRAVIVFAAVAYAATAIIVDAAATTPVVILTLASAATLATNFIY